MNKLWLILSQIFLLRQNVVQSMTVGTLRSSGVGPDVGDDAASISSVNVEPSTSFDEDDSFNTGDDLLIRGDRITVVSRDCELSSGSETDVCASDPVYPDITLGKTFSVGRKIASGATGALLELSDEAGMRRDYIVKYLFGEWKKQEEDTANEAKYYSLCIAMDLNCPKAMLVRVKVTRVNQEPFEGYVIFKDYLRNAVDLSTQGWCSIPEVRKGLDFEIQKILTYAMHPGNPFQVECFTGELPERVCSNLKDLRKSKLKGVANYPFILTDLKDANWMYVSI